jgi:hypothetical protein
MSPRADPNRPIRSSFRTGAVHNAQKALRLELLQRERLQLARGDGDLKAKLRLAGRHAVDRPHAPAAQHRVVGGVQNYACVG